MSILDQQFERTETIQRHLRSNAARYERENIAIQVLSVSNTGDVAICSVEQRVFGAWRRNYPAAELVARAETALAPLRGLGIMAMVHVRHRKLHNTVALGPKARNQSFFDWVERMKGWLDVPLWREVFGMTGRTRERS